MSVRGEFALPECKGKCGQVQWGTCSLANAEPASTNTTAREAPQAAKSQSSRR
jgi:hypothetical protein